MGFLWDVERVLGFYGHQCSAQNIKSPSSKKCEIKIDLSSLFFKNCH